MLRPAPHIHQDLNVPQAKPPLEFTSEVKVWRRSSGFSWASALCWWQGICMALAQRCAQCLGSRPEGHKQAATKLTQEPHSKQGAFKQGMAVSGWSKRWSKQRAPGRQLQLLTWVTVIARSQSTLNFAAVSLLAVGLQTKLDTPAPIQKSYVHHSACHIKIITWLVNPCLFTISWLGSRVGWTQAGHRPGVQTKPGRRQGLQASLRTLLPHPFALPFGDVCP